MQQHAIQALLHSFFEVICYVITHFSLFFFLVKKRKADQSTSDSVIGYEWSGPPVSSM